MQATPQHTFQILTKRPERLATVLDQVHAALGLTEPLPNVWLGTSIESADYVRLADRLGLAPAAVRFISAEPLLGPLPNLDLHGIDWLIIAASLGRCAADGTRLGRQLLAETDTTGTAPFVKQLGSVWAKENGASDGKGGKPADWPATSASASTAGGVPMTRGYGADVPDVVRHFVRAKHHPARAVACPHCGAHEHAPCTTVSKRRRLPDPPHRRGCPRGPGHDGVPVCQVEPGVECHLDGWALTGGAVHVERQALAEVTE